MSRCSLVLVRVLLVLVLSFQVSSRNLLGTSRFQLVMDRCSLPLNQNEPGMSRSSWVMVLSFEDMSRFWFVMVRSFEETCQDEEEIDRSERVMAHSWFVSRQGVFALVRSSFVSSHFLPAAIGNPGVLSRRLQASCRSWREVTECGSVSSRLAGSLSSTSLEPRLAPGKPPAPGQASARARRAARGTACATCPDAPPPRAR